MHDALYSDPTHLEKEQLTGSARKLGLNMAAFGLCLNSDRYTAQINRDMREGNALGVQGTPSLFINGSRAGGLTSLAEIRAAIDAELGIRGRELGRQARHVPEPRELAAAKGAGQY
jgi:protein-disulfide isomerase